MHYNFSSYTDSKLLFAVAFITPIVGAIAPLQIASVAVIAAATVVVFRIINRGPWPFSSPKITFVLIAAATWASISSTWSIDPGLSIGTAARLILAAVSLIFLLDVSQKVSPQEKSELYQWLSYGAIIGITIILLSIGYIYLDNAWDQTKAMADHELNTLNRSASVISILAWPWVLSIGKHYGRGWAIGFIIIVAATIYLLSPVTPLLGFMIGACAFTVAWVAPSCAKILLLIIMILCVGIIPCLSDILPYLIDYLERNFSVSISILHRLVIWQFASDQILAKPFIGWGLDAARIFPKGDMNILLLQGASGQPLTGQSLPLHPHNAIIQIWLELGFVGVFTFSTLILLSIKGISSKGPRDLDSAVCIATIGTTLTIAQLGYGFWQGWWLSTLGLAAIITLASMSKQVP